MIDIEGYIEKLLTLLKNQFSDRLLYVGLQGSYLRGEATEHSDVDIMIVINNLTVTDLDNYRSVIKSLPHYDKSCGFICSKEDLINWNKLEIFHLLHSTKDYWGNLQDLVPPYTQDDIRNYIKFSINSMYHELCHRYIHAEPDCNALHLPGMYKGTFFILQNLHYLSHGQFIATKTDLLPLLDGKNHDVLRHAIDLNNGISFNFSESFMLLFTWCQETLRSL